MRQGKKNPHFEIPQELKRLTLAKWLLILRCATFVPSVHLSNGTFALKGHCVTFPQDITQICNELPHRKEQVLVFICYIGHKDSSAVYPKSMQVNRQNFINSLLWLKKHNPHYSNITINKSNLDWMKDKDEANIGQEGTIMSKKRTTLQAPNNTRRDGFECPHKNGLQ